MPHCRVFGCAAHSGRPSDGSSVRLLPFPKDEEIARKWLVLCRCVNFTKDTPITKYKFTKADTICERHFRQDDFEFDLMTRLLMDANQLKKQPKLKLKQGVLPTVNMPIPTTPHTISSTRQNSVDRINSRDRKRKIEEIVTANSGGTQAGCDHSGKKHKHPTGLTEQNRVAQTETPIKQTPVRRKVRRYTRMVSTETQTEQPPLLISASTQTTATLPSLPPNKTDMETQAPEIKISVPPKIATLDHDYSRKPPKRKKQRQHQHAPRTNTTSREHDTLRACSPDREHPVRAEKDDDYKPSSDEESSEDEDGQEATPENYVNDRKYLVFESQLRELFHQARCSVCGCFFVLDDCGESKPLGSITGSGLSVKVECINGHPWAWTSQPYLGRMPVGNLLISSAILFSGQTYAHIGTFAGFLNLEFPSDTTFNNHQETYLFPTVHETYESEKQALWNSLDGREIHLSCDGRCDSPGYTAKYCTYTAMDMDTDKVVDFEVVQVSQTTSSVAMEKLGFETVMERLMDNNINVTQVCTDRHSGINALMDKDKRFQHMEHQFDIWHLGKNIFKRLLQKAKGECKELSEWIPAIRNHLWWSSKTCDGDVAQLLERWRSISYHLTNVHEWYANQVFHKCSHDPLPPDKERKKKWMTTDSPPHKAVVKVLNDPYVLKGVKKVTKFCHTGKLEVYNGMQTKYVPKRQHFDYETMVVRTKLAALDNNRNTGRKQATVKRASCKSAPVGSLRYRVVCPRSKKKWVCKPIYEGKQYGHVYDMMAHVVAKKMTNRASQAVFEKPELPPNLAPKDLVRPTRDELIDAHKSRYNQHGGP